MWWSGHFFPICFSGDVIPCAVNVEWAPAACTITQWNTLPVLKQNSNQQHRSPWALSALPEAMAAVPAVRGDPLNHADAGHLLQAHRQYGVCRILEWREFQETSISLQIPVLDTSSLLPYLLLHLGKDSRPGRNLSQCTRTASQDFHIYPAWFVPVLLTNTIQPNISSEFPVLLMNDQTQRYFISHAKPHGFAKFLCFILYRDTIRKQKCWYSGFASTHDYCLILRFFHTEFPASHLTEYRGVQLQQHSLWQHFTTERYGLTFNPSALHAPTCCWKSFSRACSPPEPGPSTFRLSTHRHTLLWAPQPEVPSLRSIWGSCQVQPQAGYWLPSQQPFFPSKHQHRVKSCSSC